MRVMFVAFVVVGQILIAPLGAQDLAFSLTHPANMGDQRDGFRVTQVSGFRPEPSIARPIVFGALLGAGSWVAGGLIGYEISNTDRCQGDSFCGLEAFLLGAAIGGSTGLVVGMHVGNNRRGNFPLVWLSSLGIWAAGIGVVLAMDDGVASEGGQNAVLLAIPVAQFAFTLMIERATGRSRARRADGMGLAIVPRPDGGLGFGLSLPLE